MPDPIFSDLYQDTEDLIWAPTEQVRRRGRQRARRTQLAAGLAAAVAVAVVATGVVLARPDAAPPPVPPATVEPITPTPAPTPNSTPSAEPSASGTSTPSRTAGEPAASIGGGPTSRAPSRTIPAAAMLQLADLPTGFTMRTGKVDGDWSLEFMTSFCVNESPTLSGGEVATRSVAFDSPSDWIVQRVTRHSGTSAATVMKNLRKLVTGCEMEQPGDSLSIMAESLGGDDGVLVGSEVGGRPGRWLVVRQGDLVAQLRLDSQTTPTEARRTARSVANRLCAGTDTC
ncbi:hypothetical protein ACLQ2Y_09540 [Micromonospora echinospora]|uniref:PknH-like extracellular domain-containing protein n=1 Tax=Micromonospora echinospora TaxID=1877 RepID=A0ABR6M6B2_MICEC|nr:hypothetical protein [Micromonospora echinospora]MBB5110614.1 hypothetical protein [Micromonospora echinospora]